MISVKNISKNFGATKAVDCVSFDISKREVVGLLGPNGAGKTTTMRILTGFIPPDSGAVEIGGSSITENSVATRRKIGYLPENTPLYEEMSVLEYLDFIAEMRGLSSRERGHKLAEMIEVCKLERMIRKDIGELSKGYRQRVGLAQALVHSPEVLVLDEPTSGLDPKQIIEIRELIKEIGKEKTVLLSTHILPEVEATCGRLLIINDGKIVAEGTTGELAGGVSGKEKITVSIKADPEEAGKALKELSFIESIKRGNSSDGYHSYHLTVVDKDAREKIFDLAVEKSWKINELVTETASLEDVFLKLTTKEDYHA